MSGRATIEREETTMATETETSRVEVRAVIAEDSGDVGLRLNGDPADANGIWLKPEKLDGDGEHYLTLAYLGEALEALGIKPQRVFPGVL